MWILKYWKFIAGGIAVLSLIGGFFYILHIECQKCKQAVHDQYAAKAAKERQVKNEIKRDVIKDSDPELDERIAKWMRD